MSNSNPSDPITLSNERSLNTLARAISLSQGEFALILVHCNYASLRDQMVQQLQQLHEFEIRQLHLPPAVKTLHTTILTGLSGLQPPVLMVFGLESSDALEQVLTSANQIREEFRKGFRFPLVLWTTDEILQAMTRLAPDFKSWAATTIKFDLSTGQLMVELQETVDAIFKTILDLGAFRFLDDTYLNQVIGKQHLLEMERAARELEDREPDLEPGFFAGLQFLQGRSADARGEREKARQYYERSLAILQQEQVAQTMAPATRIEKQGCLLLHLAMWWRQHAILQRTEYRESCLRARNYYRQSVESFQQNERPDLAAKFINAWSEVLLRLKLFDELEVVAKTADTLHQTYAGSLFLATSYGFLAEVALKRSHWTEARDYAKLALDRNAESSEPPVNREWDREYCQNWYLLLLAEAKAPLNNPLEAIAHLEEAKANALPQNDPLLYIRILENLRSLYFQQGRYLEAFKVKQEQQSIEQQYEIRAFIGAGRLQPTQHVVNPVIALTHQPPSVPQEITASGRQQDIKRLIERIARTDCKLTVIYGQSGVGKSSIVQAGLIPSLKQMMIETRDVRPVLLQVYPNWSENLFKLLDSSSNPPSALNHITQENLLDACLERLQQNEAHNFLTVLIFDQFEEFFFVYKNKPERQLFYTFLSQCLNIPFVKVILSLREDYLHYLLEFSRSNALDIINNNILDKSILYYLGNLSSEDAKSVIQNLTQRSQIDLEPALIEALVKDLAGDLDEVRPIELQVVGAQLQAEDITTLAQYQQQGPKEKLVERFLEDVIRDCGAENERAARLVLYLLTDENGTRPIKTKIELQTELQALMEAGSETLDVVLEIFVRSGLVFLLPEFSADRYQLVHDYLVSFIRQQQEGDLIRELEQERASRQRSEAELSRTSTELSRASKGRRRNFFFAFTLGCLALIALGYWMSAEQSRVQAEDARKQAEDARKQAEISEIEALNSSSEARLLANDQIGALIAGINVGRKVQGVDDRPELEQETIARLNEAGSRIQEYNSWQGHPNAVVSSVAFSPDGNLLASGSDDYTVKLWRKDGVFIKELTDHQL